MIAIPDRPADTTSGTRQEHGRTTIAPRALNRVVSAVTADIFGITAKAVRVDLSDLNGLLALTIRTPVRVAALNTARQPSAETETSNSTLIRQAADAQTMIRERVAALTGAEVAHVTIWLSGINTDEGRRVR